MSIPVEPHFLYSIRAQSSFSWRKMICEFIDNSLDADATRVDLHWPGGNVFRIEDDGRGTADLMRMITLGKRHDHATNDIGKYGVGCKQALIWLWGTSRIESRTADGASELEINWSDVAAGDAPYPTGPSVGSRTAPGTKIECFGDRSYPKFDPLISDLESTYTPGIEAGRRIVVHQHAKAPRLLTCRQWPKTTEEIDDTIEAAGRSVRIRMGIVAEGQRNPYEKGFSFERSYRVIKSSLLGANGFATSRIAARITLGKEWELSTNKDDFFEFETELAEAIQERCHELMKKASEQAMTIEEATFNQELATLVASASKKTRRESRKPSGDSVGSVEPKNTGRKRTTASESTDQPGSVIDPLGEERRRKRGFQVDTYTDNEGSFSFGYYDDAANRLRLNIGNPWLMDQHKTRNMDALLPVIYGILTNHAITSESSRMPLFADITDFASHWGSLVFSASKEGKTL